MPREVTSKNSLKRFLGKPVSRVHGKRGLERGWKKRLAKGWRRLAKGWRRVSGFPCTLQFRNSRGARLETWVCDSMDDFPYEMKEKTAKTLSSQTWPRSPRRPSPRHPRPHLTKSLEKSRESGKSLEKDSRGLLSLRIF